MPLPTQAELILGTSRGKPFALHNEEVALHQVMYGITGSGKSMTDTSLYLQLLNQNIPSCLLDPHGDTARRILQELHDTGFYTDARAYKRLLFIDFGRTDAYPAFNVLLHPDPLKAARNVLYAWERAWPEIDSAANLQNILLASVAVLASNQLSLTNIGRLLSEGGFRESLLNKVRDPFIVEFFTQRFENYGRSASILIESTLRRVFILTFSLALRHSLGQSGNLLNFRKWMDDGISVLISLAGLDEDSKRLLGCLITVGMEQAALSRSDLPDSKRRPYHFLIDEAAIFTSRSADSLEAMLTQSRKFGLTLHLIFQTFAQVGKRLQGALGNALQMAFKLSRDDAAAGVDTFFQYNPQLVKMQDGMRPTYYTLSEQRAMWEDMLSSLPQGEALMRLHDQTSRIQTIGFHPPRCTPQQLQAIEDSYAALLLTPISQLEQPATISVPQTGKPSPVKAVKELEKRRLQSGPVPIDDPLDDES